MQIFLACKGLWRFLTVLATLLLSVSTSHAITIPATGIVLPDRTTVYPDGTVVRDNQLYTSQGIIYTARGQNIGQAQVPAASILAQLPAPQAYSKAQLREGNIVFTYKNGTRRAFQLSTNAQYYTGGPLQQRVSIMPNGEAYFGNELRAVREARANEDGTLISTNTKTGIASIAVPLQSVTAYAKTVATKRLSIEEFGRAIRTMGLKRPAIREIINAGSYDTIEHKIMFLYKAGLDTSIAMDGMEIHRPHFVEVKPEEEETSYWLPAQNTDEMIRIVPTHSIVTVSFGIKLPKPKINIPKPKIPNINTNIQIPNPQLPNLQLPNVQLPNVNLPNVNVQLPNVQLPNLQLTGMGRNFINELKLPTNIKLEVAGDLVAAGMMPVKEFQAIQAKVMGQFPIATAIPQAMQQQAQQVAQSAMKAGVSMVKMGKMMPQELGNMGAIFAGKGMIKIGNMGQFMQDLPAPDVANFVQSMSGQISLKNLGEFTKLKVNLEAKLPAEVINKMPMVKAAMNGTLQTQIMSQVTGQVNGLINNAMQTGLNSITQMLSNIQSLKNLKLNLKIQIPGFNLPGFGGGGNSQDDRRLNEVLAGTNVKGSQPSLSKVPKGMPARSTPRRSPVKDGPKQMYARAVDPEDTSKPYSGTQRNRGSAPLQDTQAMTGKTESTSTGDADAERFAGCQPRLKMPDTPDPQMERMAMDICANEYILTGAPPGQTVMAESNHNDLDETSACQQLDMKPVQGGGEYEPATYLDTAWQKAMVDPEFEHSSETSDNEQSYPDGIEIENPNTDKPDFGEMTLQKSSIHGFEQIVDPTHPYTPRQFFDNNDREEYSPIANSKYGADKEHAIHCSGSPDKVIKVDLLEYRKPDFDKYINKRMDFNEKCLTDPSYKPCYTPGLFGKKYHSCKKCFGASVSKPPCATFWNSTYDRLKIKPIYMVSAFYKGGGYGALNRKAKCEGFEKREYEIRTIKKLCHDLSKPFEMANKLKVRTLDQLKVGTEKDAEDEDVMLPGMGFVHHFLDSEDYPRRPYPRCWDMGTECSGPEDPPDYMSEAGGMVAIVGIGREGERAKYAGDGSGSNDPMTGWAEMKQYQANCIRDAGVNCLCKFETVYKSGMGSDMLSAKNGVEVPIEVSPGNFVNKTWPAAFRGSCGQENKPDVPEKDSFPHGGTDEGGFTGSNLDNAAIGDAVYFETGLSGDPAKPGMPVCGEVLDVNPAGSSGGEFVKVALFNHGKNPDMTGKTDGWGKPTVVMIFKNKMADTGEIDYLLTASENADIVTKDCVDSSNQRCQAAPSVWNGAQLYKFEEDVWDGSP